MTQVKTLLDDPNFLAFMVTAKQSMYASGGVAKAMQLSGGKLYTFSDERWPRWRYTDEWYGNNPFFGHELYFERADAYGPFAQIACMPYDGYCIGTDEEVLHVFAFLRNMLPRVSTTSPFRGGLVREDGWQYWSLWRRKNAFCVDGEEGIQPLTTPMGQVMYQGSFQFCTLR